MNAESMHQEVVAVADLVFTELLRPTLDLAADCAQRIREGGKLLVCGNGGSAGDAQHFVGELINRFLKEREPYPGIALTTDTSVITAIGNDYSYDEIFSKQVEGLGRAGDVLFAISTSGNAKNVCRAVESARRRGMLTVAMTGGSGGRLASICDRVLSIGCTSSTPRIQEGHQLLIHVFCEHLENVLTGESE